VIPPKTPRPRTWTTVEIGPPRTRTSADMDHRRDRSTADMDRSEIGPYLGSLRATSGWPKNPPHPKTSEVGRFLRKRHVRRHRTPQRSLRRRHGPLGDRSLPRKSSGGILARASRPESFR